MTPDYEATRERRHMTVLFCDLVSWVELSSGMDPEDAADVLKAYHRVAKEIVVEHGGYLAQLLGDGVLAYFGYPRANEHDAPHSLFAGLSLIEAVSRIRTPSGRQLKARVGTATGEVIAGGDVELAVGGAPNLASRLQALASVDSICVDDVTYRLSEKLFDFEDLGEHELSGFQAPVRLWRAVEPRDLPRSSRLATFVGRDDELAELHRRWHGALENRGGGVMLRGSPGLGKSRLVSAFSHELATQSSRAFGEIRLFCSAHFSASALYPVIAYLERASGIHPEEPAKTKLTKLTDHLVDLRGEHALQNTSDISLIAALLSIPLANDDPVRDLPPDQTRVQTMSALRSLFLGCAARMPVLVIVEDLHWADPTTVEMLGPVFEASSELSAMIVCTARDEFESPWSEEIAPEIVLPPLDYAAVRHIVQDIAGLARASLPLERHVIQRSGGVPLFAEELTRTIIERSGSRPEALSSGALNALLATIPDTLHSLLEARLDGLGAHKSIAQVASVIGRTFTLALLACVLERDAEPGTLDEAITHLRESGHIYPIDSNEGQSYAFKHAMVQEATYNTLVNSRKRVLHQRVAESLEASFPKITASKPELLGFHFEQAKLHRKAINYWGQAGEQGVARSAYVEARQHLGQALTLLDEIEAEDLGAIEVWLRRLLASALAATLGYTTDVVGENYQRLFDISHEHGLVNDEITALRGLSTFYVLQARYPPAQDAAAKLLTVAESVGGAVPLIAAHRAVGVSSYFLGEVVQARDHLEQAVALNETQRLAGRVVQGVEDPAVASLAWLARTCWYLGTPTTALRYADRALALAYDRDHPFSKAYALSFKAHVHQLRAEVSRTLDCAQEAFEISSRHGFPWWRLVAKLLRGWALSESGFADDGLADLRQGLQPNNPSEVGLPQIGFRALYIESLLHNRLWDEAESALDDAASLSRSTGERLYDAELARFRAQVLYHKQNGRMSDAITGHLDDALCIAEQQNALAWTLRAATDAVEMTAGQSHANGSHARLEATLARFREGSSSGDIQRAKRVLAQAR